MMISCPKCGFSQPKDLYCASCGIDMLAFKPVEKTFTQKLLNNWVLQVVILGVVIAAVYSFLRDRNSIDDRVADIDDAPNVRVIENLERPVLDPRGEPSSNAGAGQIAQPGMDAKRDTSVSSFQPVNPNPSAGASTNEAPSANTTVPSADAPAPPARGLFRQAENSLGEPGAAGRSETSTTVQRVRILFAEVQRQMVADLVSNARNLANYGMQAGVITDLSARLGNGARSMRALEAATEYPVRLNQPIIVFKGTRDEVTGQNVGLTLQIVPVALDENNVTMQIEVLKVLRESSAPQLTEQNFQETFVAPKDGGTFFAVPLPRRPLSEDEVRMYTGTSVLRVLGSPAYQANTSDFLIFIEAR